MDYRELAGMSSNKSNKGKRSAGSKASGKSKEADDKKLQELDQELSDLQERIDSNPGYVAEKYEETQKKFGDMFITEEAVPEKLTEKEAVDLKELQDKEITAMADRLAKLETREELIKKRETLMELRRKIEVKMAKQSLEQKEQDIRGYDTILEIQRREAALEQERKRKLQEGFERLQQDRMGVPVEEDPIIKTKQWLETEPVAGTGIPVQDNDKKLVTSKSMGEQCRQLRSRRVMDKHEDRDEDGHSNRSRSTLGDKSQKRIKELQEAIRKEKAPSLTPSQIKIRELEVELLEVTEEKACIKGEDGIWI